MFTRKVKKSTHLKCSMFTRKVTSNAQCTEKNRKALSTNLSFPKEVSPILVVDRTWLVHCTRLPHIVKPGSNISKLGTHEHPQVKKPKTIFRKKSGPSGHQDFSWNMFYGPSKTVLRILFQNSSSIFTFRRCPLGWDVLVQAAPHDWNRLDSC